MYCTGVVFQAQYDGSQSTLADGLMTVRFRMSDMVAPIVAQEEDDNAADVVVKSGQCGLTAKTNAGGM